MRLIALLVVAAFPTPLWAHALGVDCRLRAGRVEVEAYYDDDTPARTAVVIVLNSHKDKMIEGRTDDAGRWSFPAPPPGTYRVVVDAGAGHRSSRQLIVPGAAPSSKDPLVAAPTREEFTRFPWLKLGLGVGAIAAMCAAFLVARRLQKA